MHIMMKKLGTGAVVTLGNLMDLSYAFVPQYDYSTIGTASASSGMPDDYTIEEHGQVIWPAGQGETGSGWMGSAFIPTTSTITLRFTADNYIDAVYINNTPISMIGDIHWPTWKTATVNVSPNQITTISIQARDVSGGYGLSGNVRDANSNIILQTSTEWVSA